MIDFHLRAMSQRDLAQVADLEETSFSRPWSLEQLEECLQNEKYHFLVAEDENQRILGMVSMIVVVDEGYINNVAVYPSVKRQGVGSALVEAFCQKATELELMFLTLEVRVSNVPAIALYEKFGFVSLGERRNYYEAPVENAYILTRNFLIERE